MRRFQFAAAPVVLLAACAAPIKTPPPAVTKAAQVAQPLGAAFWVEDAIPAVQAAAVAKAMQTELLQRLPAGAVPSVQRIATAADGAPSVTINAAAFEVGSAQMRPATLAPVAQCAAVAQSFGAVVVHVLGLADAMATGKANGLAERRAAAVAAYLAELGVAETRIRVSQARASTAAANGSVELVFEPIIVGREARAWMPPSR
jgi:outer membrane protein OmpA-like peptidoglycan-associated protein